jgi:hypothetical protein
VTPNQTRDTSGEGKTETTRQPAVVTKVPVETVKPTVLKEAVDKEPML